ncbi:MAG: hypothetical protein KJ847_03775, partial [Firmicutes bacterium]|nr:hypothetical protein [Bacillota bacterium]
RKYQEDEKDSNYTLIVSTASPYKFSDSICEALDIEPGKNLKETMNHITSVTNTEPDERMFNVLSSVNSRKILQKKHAFEDIKRMIGELDD